jgi:hypothetical protein
MNDTKKEKKVEVRTCKKCLIEKPIDRFRDESKVCRKCNNANGKIWSKKYRDNPENKEKIKTYRGSKTFKQSTYYRRHKKEQRAKTHIKDRATLHRRYVYKTLRGRGFEPKDITPELIETQRIIIKTKRLCKTLKNLETV